MGADDLLPLFTYVLALSNCKYLQTNISFVSALMSKRAADGLSGYAFTTMQLATEYMSQTFVPPCRPLPEPSSNCFIRMISVHVSYTVNPLQLC
jgi:hypothetical protein